MLMLVVGEDVWNEHANTLLMGECTETIFLESNLIYTVSY